MPRVLGVEGTRDDHTPSSRTEGPGAGKCEPVPRSMNSRYKHRPDID